MPQVGFEMPWTYISCNVDDCAFQPAGSYCALAKRPSDRMHMQVRRWFSALVRGRIDSEVNPNGCARPVDQRGE